MMNRFSSSLIARIRTLNHDQRIIPVKLRPRLQKLPEIRAVLFDVYGTLVDSGTEPFRSLSRRILSRQIKNLLRRAGFIPCRPSAGVSVLDTLQERIAHAHRLAHAHGIDYPEVDILNIWRQVLRLSIQRGWIKGDMKAPLITRIALEFEGAHNPVALMPGVKNMLARLHQRGISMGIVSNAQFYTPLILQILFGASLAKIGFDRSLCIWSYRFGRAKPSPDLLKLALERIGQKYG
ncbi:MAG: HAD family hydrolase, partial [Kiritimatiellia bacterium]|nr:HAD family hydrolase [Kiritimatiellia bacterium]